MRMLLVSSATAAAAAAAAELSLALELVGLPPPAHCCGLVRGGKSVHTHRERASSLVVRRSSWNWIHSQHAVLRLAISGSGLRVDNFGKSFQCSQAT